MGGCLAHGAAQARLVSYWQQQGASRAAALAAAHKVFTQCPCHPRPPSRMMSSSEQATT